MRVRLHEPAVTLTDLAVGIEAAALGILLARTGPREGLAGSPSLRPWFVLFFGATSLAAFAGAALHGLFPQRETSGRRRLWRLSLGSIGLAALSAWCLGAILALPPATAVRVGRIATGLHLAYLASLVRRDPPYGVAIATYLPGAAAFGAGLTTRLTDPVARLPAVVALAGLGLTVGAAVAQLRRIAIHPRWFDHNATYHTIQALAIACFYAAARGLIQGTGRR